MTSATNACVPSLTSQGEGWSWALSGMATSECVPTTEVTISDQAATADSQLRFLGPFSKAAMRRASLEQLEPGVWYAEVADLPGVWAEGSEMLECLHNLRDVIAEWVVLKVRDSDNDFPILDGIDLNQT
jgi:predicted RNase H-like HicB family nuclease